MSLLRVGSCWNSLTVEREEIRECEESVVLVEEVKEESELCESENLCLGDLGLAEEFCNPNSVGDSLGL